ncbi:Uncharacterized protein ESCO_003834 [Escovopsis weberi]|uniref:Delta(1)-pyrroline-2-carboxylate reductase n=1 Tax=Escovopsis weberi TaxID=150374 RepID=A0A0M8N0V8_ESCWE|nr:Uncharacterized protein ESCO_003834 [Escovopsis weberi]
MLTVLSEENVRNILENLTLDELDEFRDVLSESLHDFSTNAHAAAVGLWQQPHRITTLHPDTQATTLYMPSCGPLGMGCKVVTLTSPETSQDPDTKPISPTGVVNLFSTTGELTGLVHAKTLTAFRTALASSCLVHKRNSVKNITVFGTGMQAYWHIRLALMMRGSTIRHVYLINRRFSESANNVLKTFATIPKKVKEREGWTSTKFAILTPTFHDYERLQKEYIRSADIIYCCTPSTEDLFDGSILTSHEGRKKGRLIVAVGSYTPQMRELPEELLLLVTRAHERHHRHFHKHADEGGVIVVDTLDGVLKEAGEIIRARISPNSLVELGELVMLRRMHMDQSEDSEATSEATSPSIGTPTEDIFDKSFRFRSSSPSISAVFGRSQSPTQRSISPSGHSSKSSGGGFRHHLRKLSGSSTEREKKKKEDSLSLWLSNGTVVYKSVGLGLMDLVVGKHLVDVAKKKGVGVEVAGF